MEYLLVIIVLVGSIFGLYFFIKKQIKTNSEVSNSNLESKLDAFVQTLKDENNKNLKEHLTDTKNDQSKITRTFGEQIKNVTKSLTEIDKTNKQILNYQESLQSFFGFFTICLVLYSVLTWVLVLTKRLLSIILLCIRSRVLLERNGTSTRSTRIVRLILLHRWLTKGRV